MAKRQSNRAETTIVDEQKDWFTGAMEVDTEWRIRAIDAYRFYTGLQQWDPKVLAELTRTGRPALTINHILGIVNMISGYERQNRSEIRLAPRRGGSVAVADLGNQLLKHTMDMCDGDFELSDVFLDGCISGKGWGYVERSFDDDMLNGDLVVRKASPFDILEDQANKHYDVGKGQYIFRSFWMNTDQLELQYRVRLDELDEATDEPEWEGETMDEVDGDVWGEDATSTRADGTKKKRQYRLKECWYKRWSKDVHLIHRPTLRSKRLTRQELQLVREQLDKSGRADEFRMLEIPRQILYKSVTCGAKILEEEEDPLKGFNEFPYFRFCPYFADGYLFGCVDNLKDPQRELNKNRSQSLHNINQTANSGWKIGKPVNSYDDYIRRNGSKPGFVLDLSKCGGTAEKIMPNPLDAGHFNQSMQAGKDMKEISGVNPDMMGIQPEQTESGKARMIRQSAGLTVIEQIFDNFKRTKRSLGRFVWEMIRNTDVYSDEEIEAVIEEASLQ